MAGGPPGEEPRFARDNGEQKRGQTRSRLRREAGAGRCPPTLLAWLATSGGAPAGGGSQLLQALLRHELVERFRLMTFPLVLGSGRRLFNDGALPATMRPAGLAVTDLGIVIATYEPAGPVRHGQM